MFHNIDLDGWLKCFYRNAEKLRLLASILLLQKHSELYWQTDFLMSVFFVLRVLIWGS